MKRYNLLSLVVGLALVAGFFLETNRQDRTLPADEVLSAHSGLFPAGEKPERRQTPFLHYVSIAADPFSGQKELAGYAVLTHEAAPDIKGYGGEFRILVRLSPQGQITQMNLLSSNETPTYAGDLTAFLKQFVGRQAGQKLSLGKDLDGISGATITSQAVTDSVNQCLERFSRDILGHEEAQGPSSPKAQSFPVEQMIFPSLLFLVAVLGVITHQRKFRTAALIGGFLYFGLYQKTMLSVVAFANVILGDFPSFVQSPLWYVLLGLTSLCVLLWGSVFCGSLCPFAAMQEWLFDLAGLMRFPRLKPGALINQQARYLKYVVLVAALLVSFILGNTLASGIEPYLTLFSGRGSLLAWAMVALMLLAALFNFRFWCKFLCPVGALLGLFSRFSLGRIKLGDGCTGCRACDKACPTDAITMNGDKNPVIDYPECILCGNCVRACARANPLKGKP